MYDKKEFSKQLRRIMKERNVSQRELADMIGINPVNISRYATGERYPDLAQIVEIATALKVSLNELFGVDTLPQNVVTLEKCFYRCKPEDCDVLWALLRRYMDADDISQIFGSSGT